METFYTERAREITRNKKLLEEKLKVIIKIDGKKVTFNGPALEEYEASIILEAIDFGFPSKTALILKDEDYMFKKIQLKNHTRRKNLEDVRGRVIGTFGKTKKTIEDLSNCKLVIKNNEVGIIGMTEDIEAAITGITSLIRGSKQSNVYRYLEKNKKISNEHNAVRTTAKGKSPKK